MKQHNNDNEEFSFISLAAATANVMRYLEKDRCERPASKQDEAPADEVDREREKQRFVETRLREIRRFERSYRNNGPRR